MYDKGEYPTIKKLVNIMRGKIRGIHYFHRTDTENPGF
jgi:hypothetical protein